MHWSPVTRTLAVSTLAAVLGLAVGPDPAHAAAGPAAADKAKPKKAKKGKKGKKDKADKAKKGKAKAAALAPGEVRTIHGSAAGVNLAVKHFVLENGLKVYVVEDHSAPSFSLHLAFHVGSRDEESGGTGFAHFFEHMMFKGSQNVPEGGHFDYVLGAGGRVNAFTTSDVTQYHETLPSNYLDLALWLESDRLESLAVTDDNFENQRNAVLEERAMRVENQPYSGAMKGFFSELWSGTGYGHPTIGSKEDLEAAKKEDVQAFFSKHYVPNNAVLAIVGDVDTSEVQDKVTSYFGKLPRGEDRKKRSKIDHKQERMERKVQDPLAQQPMYVMGWKTVPESHKDRHAVDVLMRILLQGDSSRMSKLLVDEKKLALSTVPMSSFSAGGQDAGTALGAFIPVAGKTFADIKPVFEAEIASVKKKGVTAKDLKKTQNRITVETAAELATNNYRALMIARSATLTGNPMNFLEDLEHYQKVTRADVKRVANKYLTSEWVVLEIEPKK